MPIPPKTPQRRQRSKAGKAPKRDLTLLPSRPAMPDPPAGLTPPIREEWDVLWRSEVGRMLSETDVPSLRRLFHYRDHWERLQAHVRSEDFDTFTMGSAAQIKINPVFDELGKTEARILALEDRFGLNVRQRLALGASVVDTAKSLDEINARCVPHDEAEDPRMTADLVANLATND